MDLKCHPLQIVCKYSHRVLTLLLVAKSILAVLRRDVLSARRTDTVQRYASIPQTALPRSLLRVVVGGEVQMYRAQIMEELNFHDLTNRVQDTIRLRKNSAGCDRTTCNGPGRKAYVLLIRCC